MNVLLPIPDEQAERLGAADDLSRRALEAFAVAEYRSGRLTRPELQSLLGFVARSALEEFLEAQAVKHEPAPAEFEPAPEYEPADTERAGAGKALAAAFREFRRGRTLGALTARQLIREGLQ